MHSCFQEFNQQQKPKQGEENDGRETAPPQDPGTDMDAEYEARGWKIDVAQDVKSPSLSPKPYACTCIHVPMNFLFVQCYEHNLYYILISENVD